LLLRRLFAESYLPSPTGSDYTHMIGPTSFDCPFGLTHELQASGQCKNIAEIRICFCLARDKLGQDRQSGLFVVSSGLAIILQIHFRS